MVEQEYTLSQMVKYVNVLIQGKLQSTVKFCRQNFEREKKNILSMQFDSNYSVHLNGCTGSLKL